jgi:hypothetical protein
MFVWNAASLRAAPILLISSMAVGCDGFLALPAETARWSLPTRRANACVGKVLQAGNSASAVSIQLPMLQLAGVGRKDEEPSSQCADELFRAAVKLYDQVLDCMF